MKASHQKGKAANSLYTWSTAKCVRYGEDFTGESHPCYWCGVSPREMTATGVSWCQKCHGFVCPECGKCWCNVSDEEKRALQTIRNKYCCNWLNFKRGVDAKDLDFIRTSVPGFKKALDYCRERKGFKDESSTD